MLISCWPSGSFTDSTLAQPGLVFLSGTFLLGYMFPLSSPLPSPPCQAPHPSLTPPAAMHSCSVWQSYMHTHIISSRTRCTSQCALWQLGVEHRCIYGPLHSYTLATYLHALAVPNKSQLLMSDGLQQCRSCMSRRVCVLFEHRPSLTQCY